MGFKRHEEAAIDALFLQGSSSSRLGIARALASHVGDAVMRRGGYPSVEPHTSLILAASQGRGALRSSIAGTLPQIAGRVRISISPVMPAVVHLLKHGKPGEIEAALQALASQLYAVKNERATWCPGLDSCVHLAISHARNNETQKTTKTQIAASYAIRAFAGLENRLPTQHQEAISHANALYSHIR